MLAWAAEEGVDDEALRERITKDADEAMARKAAEYGPEVMPQVEKPVLLQTNDHQWRRLLYTYDADSEQDDCCDTGLT